jgi:hypothetical protein
MKGFSAAPLNFATWLHPQKQWEIAKVALILGATFFPTV